MRVQNKILLQKLDKTNAAAAQCIENESDPGQTWTCGRLLLELGTHSGVSVESTSRGIEGRTAAGFFFIMSSAWRKFTQRRRTARRSTAVAVDLPLFARISSLSYVFLTALRGFLDMTKRPLVVSLKNK